MDDMETAEDCEVAEDRAEWDSTQIIRVGVVCEQHGYVTDYEVTIDGEIVCAACASDEQVKAALR